MELEELRKKAELITLRRTIRQAADEAETEKMMTARREQIRAANREYNLEREREIAACNHRWEDGKTAVRGQGDGQGGVVAVCQRCQEVKLSREEIMNDPKWRGADLRTNTWGGPGVPM